MARFGNKSSDGLNLPSKKKKLLVHFACFDPPPLIQAFGQYPNNQIFSAFCWGLDRQNFGWIIPKSRRALFPFPYVLLSSVSYRSFSPSCKSVKRFKVESRTNDLHQYFFLIREQLLADF